MSIGVLCHGGWPSLRVSGSALSALQDGMLSDTRVSVTLVGCTQIIAKISQKLDLKDRDKPWVLTNLCKLDFFPQN